MPGGNVELIAIMGQRGSGKSEYAVPLFLQYESGVYLDMGVASDFFKYPKDNRLQVSFPRALNLKDALHYLNQSPPSHFSFKPMNDNEANEFIRAFSKSQRRVLLIDDAQKLLNYYDANQDYKDFISDGRMNNQSLILCFHRITEVSIKTRSEATQLIHMGPIKRPSDLDSLYGEWTPEMKDELPSKDVLYRELLSNPQYQPYFIKK